MKIKLLLNRRYSFEIPVDLIFDFYRSPDHTAWQLQIGNSLKMIEVTEDSIGVHYRYLLCFGKVPGKFFAAIWLANHRLTLNLRWAMPPISLRYDNPEINSLEAGNAH